MILRIHNVYINDISGKKRRSALVYIMYSRGLMGFFPFYSFASYDWPVSVFDFTFVLFFSLLYFFQGKEVYVRF